MDTTITLEPWYARHLFVKLRPTAVVPVKVLHKTRYGWKPSEKVKLPPVYHGCSLTVDDLTGMRAIRAGMLLAALNAHEAFLC